MALNQQIISRLSFIKYLYQKALEDSNLPSPQSSAAILTFHDSIELFLRLSTEFLNIYISGRTNFMGFFDIIKKHLNNQELSQKSSMDRLNRARNNLKHSGILIRDSDIETFKINAKDFFQDNTPLIFRINFDDISLIDLVHIENVRFFLNKAIELSNNGEHKEALEYIAAAFENLIEEYTSKKSAHRGFRSTFPFKTRLSRIRKIDPSSISHTYSRGDLEDVIREIREVIEVLCLKIDYRKYAKFKILTPHVFIGEKIGNKYNVFWSPKQERKFNREHIEYCINFVVEAALKLHEFDFDIDNI